MWHYDLRPLFLTDAFSNSAVYDASPGDWVLSPAGPERLPEGTRRACLSPLPMDEPAFQAGLASLLLSAAGITGVGDGLPAQAPGVVLRWLRRQDPSRLVVSHSTLESLEAVYLRWSSRHLFARSLPGKLDTAFRLFYRDVFLHPSIPSGVLLVPAVPEKLGFINTPTYLPYPARALAFAGGVTAVRVTFAGVV